MRLGEVRFLLEFFFLDGASSMQTRNPFQAIYSIINDDKAKLYRISVVHRCPAA